MTDSSTTNPPPAGTTEEPLAAPAALVSDQRRLDERLRTIEAALQRAGDEVDPTLVERARSQLTAVEERLRLGVDHTVVALVGGTGSGKSSLFNAISGLGFADVGALRPTTERAAACGWGEPAGELLDFLGIADHRRIERESELDADDQRELHGLVLLDMPDYDSVAERHWQQVDRLLPMVDLLLWVVDPQKYADDVLHSRYLRALTGRSEAMLVLVNQADTIGGEALPVVEESLRELLVADGLGDVPIIMTSATTHTGVSDVRRHLAEAVARTSTAARTAEAEIDMVAERLSAALGPTEPALAETADKDARETILAASGAEALAESLRRAATRPFGGSVAPPQEPARATVEAARSGFLTRAQAGLPQRWQQRIGAEICGAETIRGDLSTEISSIELPQLPRRGPRVLQLIGMVLLVIGVLALAGLGIAMASGASMPGGALGGGSAVVAVVGLLALLVARWWRRHVAGQITARYLDEATARSATIVETHLRTPAEEVLDRHRQLREALHQPRSEPMPDAHGEESHTP